MVSGTWSRYTARGIEEPEPGSGADPVRQSAAPATPPCEGRGAGASVCTAAGEAPRSDGATVAPSLAAPGVGAESPAVTGVGATGSVATGTGATRAAATGVGAESPAVMGTFVPDPLRLAALLDEYAPLGPAPLVPEIMVFQGRVLLELWSAAERLAGGTLGAPFWAYPWPGGIALARLLLDRPELVAGMRVLDLGTGGGVAALAAARAGAASVVANDRDPWALVTASLAAERQGLALTPLLADVAGEALEKAPAEVPGEPLAEVVGEVGRRPGEMAGESIGLGAATESASDYGVVLCADLAYERCGAPRIRAFLDAARAGGARVLVADAGRAYFDDSGCTLQAEYLVPVPRDLEGTDALTARVYLLD